MPDDIKVDNTQEQEVKNNEEAEPKQPEAEESEANSKTSDEKGDFVPRTRLNKEIARRKETEAKLQSYEETLMANKEFTTVISNKNTQIETLESELEVARTSIESLEAKQQELIKYFDDKSTELTNKIPEDQRQNLTSLVADKTGIEKFNALNSLVSLIETGSKTVNQQPQSGNDKPKAVDLDSALKQAKTGAEKRKIIRSQILK